MHSENFIIVTCDVERETHKAVLLDLGEAKKWVPKSQINNLEEFQEGDEDVEVQVSKWLVDKWDEEEEQG